MNQREHVAGFVVFGGYSRAGKDTAAEALTKTFGHQPINLGSVVTDLLLELDPLMPVYDTHMRVSEALSTLGYERTKEIVPEFVKLIQGLCVATRDVDPEFLAKAAFRKIRKMRPRGTERVVLTGTRHPAEPAYFRQRGALSIWISRPGLAPRNGHRAETCATPGDYDLTIVNDGTIEQLHDKVLREVTREEFWG